MCEKCLPKKETNIIESKQFDIAENLNISFNQMVLIPGGKYIIGTIDEIGYPIDNEGQPQEINLREFYIDKTSVTNNQFQKFVQETGYITEAELIGASFVFHLLVSKENQGTEVVNLPWWRDVKGATWKHPFGDHRSIDKLLDHPVVHVTVKDALAYCKWAGKRLPSETEWQIAAAGGTSLKRYPWGNTLMINNEHQCNIWQGEFPLNNTKDDGYLGTAPVTEFYVNDYGIHQMIGNVWEICSNEARIDLDKVEVTSLNQQIESHKNNSFNNYAVKGGSFLCHDSYCNRYRLAARNGLDSTSSASNLGFRCARDSI